MAIPHFIIQELMGIWVFPTFGAILNNAAMIIHVWVFVKTYILFFFPIFFSYIYIFNINLFILVGG